MILKILILGILLSNISQDCDGKKGKSCSKLLNQYSDGLKNFLTCSMKHSVPVNLCLQCIVEYKIVLSQYNAFINGEFPNGDLTEKCSEKYFDQDHLNIVLKNHNHFESLWNQAHCYECFSGNNMTNSSDVNQMIKKISIFKNCVNNTLNTSPCKNCSNDYNDANTFYKKLLEKHKNRICDDIQDEMNRTRLLWSKKLKCTIKEVKVMPFAVLATIISSLPILFYFSFYIYSKRTENVQSILYENQESVGSSSDFDDNNSENLEGAIGGESVNEQNKRSTREAPEEIDDIDLIKSKNKSLSKEKNGKVDVYINNDTDNDEPKFSTLKDNNSKGLPEVNLIDLNENKTKSNEEDNINILDDTFQKVRVLTAKTLKQLDDTNSANKSLKNITKKVDNLQASSSKTLIDFNKEDDNDDSDDEVNILKNNDKEIEISNIKSTNLKENLIDIG